MAENFWLTLPRPILALAPMEGVNDTAFRQLCKLHGADLVYTEFVSADAIVHEARKSMERLRFDPVEQPVIAQIFGRNPESFKTAAKVIEKLGFAGLDINFGCPAKKVVRRGEGVALLREPKYARELIQIALDCVSIPVSIKIRTSIRKEQKDVDNQAGRHTAIDFIEAIGDLPIQAIMVHGRAFEQGHQGDVDTTMIQAVKQRYKGLVLANGGIFTPERVVSMLQETGADGVGIARGTWGSPWIFNQARQLLETGSYEPVSWETIKHTILDHARLSFTLKGEHGIIELRKHLVKYISGWRNAKHFRAQAVQVQTPQDVEKLVSDIETSRERSQEN